MAHFAQTTENSWELHGKVNCQPDWTVPAGHEISALRWSQVSPKPCWNNTPAICSVFLHGSSEDSELQAVYAKSWIPLKSETQNQGTRKLRNISNYIFKILDTHTHPPKRSVRQVRGKSVSWMLVFWRFSIHEWNILFQSPNLCTIYYEMLIHNSSQAFNAGIICIF